MYPVEKIATSICITVPCLKNYVMAGKLPSYEWVGGYRAYPQATASKILASRLLLARGMLARLSSKSQVSKRDMMRMLGIKHESSMSRAIERGFIVAPAQPMTKSMRLVRGLGNKAKLHELYWLQNRCLILTQSLASLLAEVKAGNDIDPPQFNHETTVLFQMFLRKKAL